MHLIISFIFYFIPVAPFLLFTLPGLTSGTPGTFLPTPRPCPSHTEGHATILGWNSDNFFKCGGNQCWQWPSLVLCSGAESVNIKGTWHVLQHERDYTSGEYHVT